MAAYDGTLKFDTSIDDKGLQKGLDGLEKKAKDALGVLTGNLMTQAVNALTELGQTALDAGMSLEAGMAKVSTLFTGTDEELGALTAEIRELSTASGLAADGLAEAAYSALSASVPAEQLGAMLERSTKLAAAGFTDVDTALSATAKTMNAYGLAGEEAMDRVQKVLIQTQNKGITTVGELGAYLSQVTPTAASFGVAFEQVGAALAVMTAQGVPTAQAATMLNGIIAELGKSGTQAAGNLEKAAEGSKYAGMNFTQMMEAGATLDEVLGLMSNYAEANGLAMVDMFSRIEAGKGALSIMANEGQTFRDDLAAMATDADVVGEAYEKVSDTVQFKGQQIKAGFANIASGLFDLVSGPLKDAQDATIGALERIQDGLSENGLAGMGEALFGLLEDAAGAISDFDWGPVVQTITDGITGFIEGDGLGRILDAVMGVLSSVVSGISAALPQLMTLAVQAIGYIRQALWEQLPVLIDMGLALIEGLAEGAAQALPVILARASDIVLGIIDTITAAVPKIIETGSRVLGSIVDAIPAVIGVLSERLPEILEAIVSALNAALPELTQAAVTLFSALVNALPGAINALLASLPQLFSALYSAFQAAAPELLSVVNTLFGVLADALPVILSALTTALAGAVPLLLEGAKALFGAILEALPGVLTALTEALSVLIEAILAALPALTDAIVVFLVEGAPLLLEAAIDFLMVIVDALPGIIDALIEALPALIEATVDFLVGAVPELIDAATEMFQAIVDALPGIIDALVEVLPGLIDAVVTALVEAVPQILDAAIEFLMAIVDALPTIIEALMDALPDLISSVLDALIEAIPKLLDAAIDFFMAIVDAVPDIVEALMEALPDIIDAIFETLTDAAPKILQAAVDLFGQILEAIPGVVEKLFEAGKEIISGLWKGIKEAWGSLTEGFGNLVGGLVDKAKDIFGIQSPSRVFRQEVGAWIPPGISQGVDDAMPAALDDMNEQADRLVGRMRTAIRGDLGSFDAKLAVTGSAAAIPVIGPQAAAEPSKWEQVNNYYVPVVSPSEAARTQREALRAYVGGVQ